MDTGLLQPQLHLGLGMEVASLLCTTKTVNPKVGEETWAEVRLRTLVE